MTREELKQIETDALIKQFEERKDEDDLQAEVIQACVIDPQFESIEQVKKILPKSLQRELYSEITRGAIGENIVTRFPDSNR